MALRASSTRTPPRRPAAQGGFRSLRLFRGFLGEQSDPEGFYTMLADDAVGQIERHVDLAGRTVVDVGGGSGYFTAAFGDRGANGLLVEPDPGELRKRGEPRRNSVVGDGYRLPIQDASADVSFSSNVLEHVPDPGAFIDEMVRVTRPGGIVYLSYTLWLSPWGGHETSPFHYLGGHRAIRLYTRRYGHTPKNRVGENVFRVSVSFGLRWARRQPDATLLEARPRYYPRWTRGLLRVPGLREFATWTLFLVLRKR
jgi:SAM-dependent methyltransferase